MESRGGVLDTQGSMSQQNTRQIESMEDFMATFKDIQKLSQAPIVSNSNSSGHPKSNVHFIESGF